MDVHGRVVEAFANTHEKREELDHYAKAMADCYTDYGLPPDMALTELKKKRKFSEDELVYLISVLQSHLLEHRRKSGITEARVEKIRVRNRDQIEAFIKTGEMGIY